MIRLVEEITTTHYLENKIRVEYMEHYQYETDKERIAHKKIMEAIGYEHSGQVSDNIGTVLHPLHIFAGYFTRQSIIDTTEKSVE